MKTKTMIWRVDSRALADLNTIKTEKEPAQWRSLA
jgi:hypothetical protein